MSKTITSAIIYAAALKHLGTAEVKGKASNPKIRAWIKQAAQWLDGDDSATAWCGCFRGAIGLATGTGVPREHYRAASWATWGQAVDITNAAAWQKGDTIVMTRPGGNHVCLFDRLEGNVVFCLGGNQGDAVTIDPYPRRRITHIRR